MGSATFLQTATNRFSGVAGFAPLAVDGVIGNNTLAAVQRALGYLAVDIDEPGGWLSDSPSELAASYASKANTISGLVAYQAFIGAFLQQQADRLKLPNVAGPVVSSGGGGISPPIGPIVSTNPASASLIDTWRGLAMWKKIAIGGLIGAILIFLHGRYRRSRGLAGPKLHLFTYRNKHNSWSDVWATDIDDARDQIRKRKNASGFFEIARVKNVPPREVA